MRERSSPGARPTRPHLVGHHGCAPDDGARGCVVEVPNKQVEEVAGTWPLGVRIYVSFLFGLQRLFLTPFHLSDCSSSAFIFTLIQIPYSTSAITSMAKQNCEFQTQKSPMSKAYILVDAHTCSKPGRLARHYHSALEHGARRGLHCQFSAGGVVVSFRKEVIGPISEPIRCRTDELVAPRNA